MDDRTAFERRLAQIRACRLDLLTQGIDLLAGDEAGVRDVVTEHLEYFQGMVGGDPTASELVALVWQECGGGRSSSAAPASDGTRDSGRLARRRARAGRMTLDELRAWAGELQRRAAEDEQDLAVLKERMSQFAPVAKSCEEHSDV